MCDMGVMCTYANSMLVEGKLPKLQTFKPLLAEGHMYAALGTDKPRLLHDRERNKHDHNLPTTRLHHGSCVPQNLAVTC